MKKIIYTNFLFVFFLGIALDAFSQFGFASKSVSVLFIGNSYTYVNDLPLMIDSLAAANGDTLIYTQSTPGGYSLQDHTLNAQTIASIQQQQWDFVVLQEQSQRPSLDPSYVDASVIPYLLYLDSLIKQNNLCTQVVLFETWGRRYGDASNCSFYPPVCTYGGMQDRLRESYKRMADTVHGIMAPVGEAFRNMIQFDSTVVLYDPDNSHPSLKGTYLAACAFYQVLFHRTSLGNTFTAGMTIADVQYLQLFADATVKGSLNTWNIGIHEPWASFTWQQLDATGLTSFQSVSDSSLTHFWDFGDSTTSSDANPIHQYTWSQYFPVRHVVCNSCKCDTFFLTNNIIIFPSSLSELNSEYHFRIFPNPIGSENINIVCKTKSSNPPELFSCDGKKLTVEISETENGWLIQTNKLSSGIYLIRIPSTTNTGFKRMIKL